VILESHAVAAVQSLGQHPSLEVVQEEISGTGFGAREIAAFVVRVETDMHVVERRTARDA
jgi:hypothetical protein